MRPGAFSLLFRMHTTSLGFDDVSDLSLRNSTRSAPPRDARKSRSSASSSDPRNEFKTLIIFAYGRGVYARVWARATI